MKATIAVDKRIGSIFPYFSVVDGLNFGKPPRKVLPTVIKDLEKITGSNFPLEHTILVGIEHFMELVDPKMSFRLYRKGEGNSTIRSVLGGYENCLVIASHRDYATQIQTILEGLGYNIERV